MDIFLDNVNFIEIIVILLFLFVFLYLGIEWYDCVRENCGE